MTPGTEPRPDHVSVAIHGVGVDAKGRCAHYASHRDIVAVRLPCCDRYYACHECHRAVEDHEPARWPVDGFDEEAILCGACREPLSIHAYLTGRDACPSCGAAFNPACATHHPLYFELERG